MAQTANTIPAKGLWTLRLADLWKGFIKVAGGLIVGLVIKSIQDKHFPTYDQVEPLLEAGAYFFLGYLGINTVTNNVGQPFKADKDVVTVGTQELADLQAQAEIKTTEDNGVKLPYSAPKDNTATT